MPRAITPPLIRATPLHYRHARQNEFTPMYAADFHATAATPLSHAPTAAEYAIIEND